MGRGCGVSPGLANGWRDLCNPVEVGAQDWFCMENGITTAGAGFNRSGNRVLLYLSNPLPHATGWMLYEPPTIQ